MFPAKKAFFFFTHLPWLHGCILHAVSLQDACRRSKSKCVLAYSQVSTILSMPVSFSGQHFVLFSCVGFSLSSSFYMGSTQILSYTNNLRSTEAVFLQVPAKRSHIAAPKRSLGPRKHTGHIQLTLPPIQKLRWFPEEKSGFCYKMKRNRWWASKNKNFISLVFSSWPVSVNLGQCFSGESRQRKQQELERRQKEGKKGMIILIKSGEMASNLIALEMSQTCSNFLF